MLSDSDSEVEETDVDSLAEVDVDSLLDELETLVLTEADSDELETLTDPL